MKKNQFNNKEKNKYLCDTAALLAMLLIAANTYSLIMFHYYFTYEENLLFDQTPKSSYLTIIQHKPVFLVVYVLCDITLLFCGIYRLRIKKKSKHYIKTGKSKNLILQNVLEDIKKKEK